MPFCSSMGLISRSVLIYLLFVSSVVCQVAEFISIDCGSTTNYTDPSTGLAWISDTGMISHGKSVQVENPNGNLMQYRLRRDFPIDSKKYCYTLSTRGRRRYLVRATFQHGGLESEVSYPKFRLFLDATQWATLTVLDSSRVYVEEMIIRAPSDSIDVCICCGIAGSPFISTIELRPLNLSMYATDFEDNFFLKVAARVNFGAPSMDAVRNPDDPYDRIWESDLDRRQNYLVGEAPGTLRINTTKNIDTRTREYPPVKVMQSAVVGTAGELRYRLNLEYFPANARAYAYFAEIEDLGANETRKFKLHEPYTPDYSNAVVNIAENANGSYTLYEPSHMNMTFSFIPSFSFVKTRDSTRGPLLNAIEISKYQKISAKTDKKDVIVLDALRSMSDESDWTNDSGDPCVPARWNWVTCSSTTPPRITKILCKQRKMLCKKSASENVKISDKVGLIWAPEIEGTNLVVVCHTCDYMLSSALSGKKVKDGIPSGLNNMVALTELWLDGNYLTGQLPDMSNLINLKIMHLENNKLTGLLPSYLGSLPSLQKLHIENNSFSGEIPQALLTGKVIFKYNDNPELCKGSRQKRLFKIILRTSIGVLAILLVLFLGILLLLHNFRRKVSNQKIDDKGDSLKTSTKPSNAYSIARGVHFMDEGVAFYISLSELELATNSFSKKIGKGRFGSVYYGKMKDGKEIAVKIMADSSTHMTQQFVTEVALLSRIHHRNLVPLIGYCEEEHQRLLVYEYMHNGTLKDCMHCSVNQKPLDWLVRLQIAEDAAKGLEYLHTGCNPSIIHRDVKTSNILLDINMRAKLSDFGLPRQAEEDLTHISSVARGTVGSLDPEYFAIQQLSEKSDVYSFGVVLLELVSGRKPISVEDFGAEMNIVHWARSLIRKGDVISIVDPFLIGNVKMESIWRIAEIAVQCVEQRAFSRPRMQEIVLAIQDAMKIEKGSDQKLASGSSKTQSSRKTLLTSFLEIDSPDLSNGA